jgi:hypothetical protein
VHVGPSQQGVQIYFAPLMREYSASLAAKDQAPEPIAQITKRLCKEKVLEPILTLIHSQNIMGALFKVYLIHTTWAKRIKKHPIISDWMLLKLERSSITSEES